MKYYLILLCTILPFFAMAQNEDKQQYSKEWKKADSLIDRGFPESALKVLEGVYQQAKGKDQQLQMLKAQLYMIKGDFQKNEEAAKDAIIRAEKETANTKFPVNAVWQSITAQLYWNYYTTNRWKILDRTRVSSNTDISDLEQWDAARFFDKITALYDASIARAEELKQVNISAFDPILVKGVNTRNLRPTLFDLLAFRAIDFYQDGEKDATKPTFQFVMDDAKAFAPANEFITHKFQTEDTASGQWHALILYQQILKLHKNDAVPDAFIDADLLRLDFAFNHSVHPDRKALYVAALEEIEKKYSNNRLSALAGVKIAQQMSEATGNTHFDKRRGPRTQPAVKQDYRAQKQKLESIISKFPESEGGILAKQMLQGILVKYLTMQSEDVVLPNEASRILVSYRNLQEANFRVVKLDPAEYKNSLHNYEGNKWNNYLLKLEPVQSMKVSLPGTEDYDSHAAEIKVDALPIGMYAIIASAGNNFSKDNNILSYNIFQVSNLSVITSMGGSGNNGYVLHRKDGSPIAGAKVELYKENYNGKLRRYETIKSETFTSANDGAFSGNKKTYEYYNGMVVKTGNDAWYNFNSYNLYNGNEGVNKPQTRTFFFTDRSIYRPGQTIFFKGIMVNVRDGGKKNDVIANKETEVTFYDVNGQKVSSLKLKTNEFGSFTGQFTAPEGVLTGSMRIDNGSGNAYFSIEEYKRPKFAVSFEKLTGTYSLNDEIKMTGKAEAYAGNTIDGATVKYRVTRGIRFPYWWLYYRWYGGRNFTETEIVNGTTTTDKAGNFKVTFTAKPDLSIDKTTLPVFIYTVHADVTDINGETRSTSQAVNAGYTSVLLSAVLPGMASPSELDTITIRSENLNNEFVPTLVQVKISLLKAPDHVLRKRLWQMPDQFIMDEATFKKYFPNDEYKDEADHTTWDKLTTVYDKQITSTKDGKLFIGSGTWNKNGWYVIELETKDKKGAQVLEKKYVQVWGEKNSGTVSDALVVIPSTQTKEPGEKAIVNTVSGYKNLHLLQQEQDMDNKVLIKQIDYSKPYQWTRQISETDRGGIIVSYITVKENRVYTQTAQVVVPWSNKDLNISWETHRDKLLPGQKETWTMVVSGPKKEKVAAEMVAGMYDASLDAFKPHNWSLYGLYPSISNRLYLNTSIGFGIDQSRQIAYYIQQGLPYYDKRYDELFFPGNYGYGIMYERRRGGIKTMAVAGNVAETETAEDLSFAPPGVSKQSKAREEKDASVVADQAAPAPPPQPENTEVAFRKNLQETAFFFPQLRTDANGNIRIEFSIPEALTEWKFMALAHTPDMKYGQLEGKVKTQKDLMVMPGLPRFFRQGDEMVISTKISNLSNKDMSGTATLSIVNALTLQPLELPFRLQKSDEQFSVPKGESTTATWKVSIPQSLYVPVLVRIYARSGNFTDGEENAIPVLTNRMMVTETLPLWIHGNGTKDFSFDKLKHSDTSKTLSQYNLTLEYTGNPAWYAVQALPYLMDYPYECAEQTFNRFYANALAANIVERSPKIESIFRRWEEEAISLSSDMSKIPGALISNLEQNEELKSALLEETPWVLESKNETEQKKRIAMLFETHKLARSLDANMRKLKDMQMPEGAFPWFRGMYPDRYITQYIMTGIGRLQTLGIKDRKGNMQEIISRALPYLDRKIKEDYDQLIKNKVKLDQQNISYFQVQYLYMRSFFSQKIETANETSFNYYKKQAAKYWPSFNAYMKGMIALSLNRYKETKEPKDIIASLKETAMKKDEMGMYWMKPGISYWWHDAPIEAQSLLIECFSEVAKDTADIDLMKVWLLKQKQTQNWGTTKATADACYALLLNVSEWLSNEPQVTVQLGNEVIKSNKQKQQAGSGYFKANYEGVAIKPEMGNIKVTVQDNEHSTSWGAVYWQYFEDMDKITSAATPLVVKKQLFIERNTNRGPELQPITNGNTLTVGDKVTARIEIIVDRDMEYVHLKDMRAACFEPVNVISSYKYQGGLGYYEATKDASTNFFFGYLPKGKYVFEYPVFVTNKGDFSNGIATIQCMYAPEFSSHSEGIRVQVK